MPYHFTHPTNTEVLVMPSFFRPCLSILTAALLASPNSFAFQSPLSNESIREAYFLGQRNDERTGEFLEKYRRHLSVPESGPWVSTVELFTPYAEAIDLSRQRSLGYSAQDAALDYRKHGNLIRVTVTLEFTNSYGYLIEEKIDQRSGSTTGFSFRSPDFWKDFTYRLFDSDDLVEPIEMQGNATFRTVGNSTVMTGAVIVLVYDAEKISSSADAAVVVDTPDGQQAVGTFDLATLR
jgi:hypothetical protein